jgi:formate dehydrogenase iron-sulfur subunit
MTKVFIPRDASALSVGAEAVAKAIAAEAKKKKTSVEIVRTGTRGMLWLEPLVEVETKKGRVAYGPVKPADVPSLFKGKFLEGGKHKLCHGLTEEIPYFKKQERLTFARCGIIDPLSIKDYRAHGGFDGLEKALQMKPADIVAEVTTSGLRGRGGAGFPTGIKWKTVLDTKGDQKYICCNADEGDSGTFADRFLPDRRHDHRRHRNRRHARLHLPSLRVPACHRRHARSHRGREGGQLARARDPRLAL